MQDYGLVSVITPSYNCARFIGATIESVLQQTYTNWEMLIVDDCSIDESQEVIERYVNKDSRIKLFVLDRNSGAAIARTRAMQLAKGRYMAFLDSDDLWEPLKLEKQIHFMLVNGYQFSYTNYGEINEQSEETGRIISGPKHITKIGMYAFCWPGCLTVMYDRERVGLIQIEDIKRNNDYAMWLKVVKKVDCYLLDECLAKYRRGRLGSISTQRYVTLIKWHYKLFRESEGMNPILSFFITCMNMVCGFYKKLRYINNCNDY